MKDKEYQIFTDEKDSLKREEEYPPRKFCEENCPSASYGLLTEFEKEDLSKLLKNGTDDGKKIYEKRLRIIRQALGCSECLKAIEWEMEDTKKKLESVFKG